MSFDALPDWAALSIRWKLLSLATVVFVVELAFRRLAPGSRAYAKWTSLFETIGAVWTSVVLAVVYFFSVGPIGLIMRAARRDELDRTLTPESSFWRNYKANPLGPRVSSRHQF